MSDEIYDKELSDMIRDAVREELMNTRVSLPGVITSYDASKQRAEVQPLIKKKICQDNPNTPKGR